MPFIPSLVSSRASASSAGTRSVSSFEITSAATFLPKKLACAASMCLYTDRNFTSAATIAPSDATRTAATSEVLRVIRTLLPDNIPDRARAHVTVTRVPECLMRRPAPKEIAAIPLFKRLRHEDLDRVAANAELRDYARGDGIFDEGDDSTAFVVVVSGRVKVSKQAPDGRDVILEMFGAGGPIG